MASSSTSLLRLQSACVTCIRGGRRFVGRYRDFLLAPGTIFTLVSLLLLVIATIQAPDGVINSAHAHTWLYLAAALVGSVYIWWSAIQGIRERDFTADIPVSFATAAALIIGQYSAAAVVAVLLLLGGMLEEFVSARAGNALDSLAKLLPDRVTVRRDGEDLVVPLEEVQSADLVLIRSGDRIPIDGVVARGIASVNQAAITGESLAVEKQQGDAVFAGTLNELGALEVRATKVGGRPRLVRSAAWSRRPSGRKLRLSASSTATPSSTRPPRSSWGRWSGGSVGISCAPLPF
jgi:Cd2+/Zn2+-exporting ATPase